MANKFIVFEGLDGSGKTTQGKLLSEAIKRQNERVFFTKEPTNNSPFSKKIKNALSGKEKVAPIKLQYFFARDREWHLENDILPKLENKVNIISDRYLFSSFAFGMADGVPYEYIFKLNKDFLIPDYVFFIDLPPKLCIRRIEKRGEPKKLFENYLKLEKAYNNYRSVLNDFRNRSKIYFINGKRPIKTILTEIKKILKING